jgi:hypothetical protein
MGVLIGVDEFLKKHENPGKKEEKKSNEPEPKP